jgi:hypothetical protein
VRRKRLDGVGDHRRRKRRRMSRRRTGWLGATARRVERRVRYEEVWKQEADMKVAEVAAAAAAAAAAADDDD